MIKKIGENGYCLQTENTTYLFRVMETGQLEHLYYGKKLYRVGEGDIEALSEKHSFPAGNLTSYDQEHFIFSLEDQRLEMSAYGKSDIREPFLEVTHRDGSSTSDFKFEKAEFFKGKKPFATLPGSYFQENHDDEYPRADESQIEVPAGSPEANHLCITLTDAQYDLALELHYYVFEDCDIITRSAKLVNNSEDAIFLDRLMSLQMDYDMSGYVLTSFQGAWAREMQRKDTLISGGKYVVSSYTGTTSSRANPFVMLHPASTSEDAGEVYGFNLLYSGNHYEAAEVNSFGKTRFVTGINPQTFRFVVEPGASFEAPEAVMGFSDQGYNGLSRGMHRFVRNHIVRGEWAHKRRPILLNSWEAAYFDINESKLVKLAKAGKAVGIELLVMDDGWFGERNNDTTSLGDWDVNPKKLPGGLRRLAEKINDVGLEFGIWVEPEMVNVKSKLYEAHPEWSMEIPGKPHTEGRSQRILDLANPEVQTFIIEKMSEVFDSANITYVKWDMNRIFSDYFSQSLPADRQGEAAHRYVCGLYHCLDELTKRFPHILFEGCSAGGNRFDLGALCYYPQIWGSDDTDALCRAYIQTGYSYGYPLSCVSAHVSACPNHQTLRTTPLNTRYNVAAFGAFGYECNLCDMKKEDVAAIKAQIAQYKQWQEVLLYGDFYRGRSFGSMPVNTVNGISGGSAVSASAGIVGSSGENLTEWTVVSPDGKRAVGMIMQQVVMPNTQFHTYYPKGLREDAVYHLYSEELKVDVRKFGDLINTVSPIHLKQDSLILNVVAKFVKMEGESEDVTAGGSTLMHGGIHLKPAFGGTGYSGEVRYFQDFGSRMYFMEMEEPEEEKKLETEKEPTEVEVVEAESVEKQEPEVEVVGGEVLKPAADAVKVALPEGAENAEAESVEVNKAEISESDEATESTEKEE